MFAFKLLSVTLWILFSSLVSAFPTSESHSSSLHRRKGGPLDVTGEHEFRPPQKGDQRGPCPGLNALANHGYIDRSGIVGMEEVSQAVTGIFNMGFDIGTIIPIQGVLWAGDPLSMRFSIGGPDQRVGAPLGGLLGVLGKPQGLDWTHNMIEVDSSGTRNDLADTGDAWTMNTTRFQQMMDAIPRGGEYTNDVVADLAAKRFYESIAESPNFWYGPYSGFIARNAGYNFMSRLMADYSSGGEGVLTHDIIRSFFAIDESGKYNYGWERIPQNWTPRPTGYTLLDLNMDLLRWMSRYPELASIGGNMGKVNTFTPVNLGDPVSGLANAPRLLEGNNFVCFALQALKLGSPTILNNLYTTIEKPLGELLSAVSAQTNFLGCPAWDMLTHGGKSIFDEWAAKFPGARDVPL